MKNALEKLTQVQPQPKNKSCISGLKKELGVELLYSEANIKGPITLFWIVKDSLVREGMKHEPETQGQRTLYDLVNHFLGNADDKYYAKNTLRFKKVEKFTGRKDEDITEFICNYKEAGVDYDL